MRMNKKRALVGYHPFFVQQYIESLKSAYVEERTRLTEKLAELAKENDQLKQQVQELTKQVADQLSFEKEISEQLLKPHLNYAKKTDKDNDSSSSKLEELGPEQIRAN